MSLLIETTRVKKNVFENATNVCIPVGQEDPGSRLVKVETLLSQAICRSIFCPLYLCCLMTINCHFEKIKCSLIKNKCHFNKNDCPKIKNDLSLCVQRFCPFEEIERSQ